ncbi:sensor histidine kinase [Niallia nealsonii]|uniref:Signal transduction histidine-protein kinase ArlS n=1 Tax=Niallia nealsonii TaxID=115979 RepID=A0A2N0YYS2_9BACI|nr:ATP-binding protein [Niallia nealsonii]PKG22402.1 two-component sensor histidine kinase [Niallia nealsonii]
MKIRTRIQLFSTIFLFIIMLVVNMSIYIIFQTLLYNDVLNKTMANVEQATTSIQTLKTEASIENMIRAYVPADGMIQIIGANETILTSTKNADYAKVSSGFETRQIEEIVEQNNHIFAVVNMPIIWEDGTIVTLVMTENIESTRHILGILGIILIAASIIIIIPTYFAGRLLSNLLLSPIQSMIKTMEEIQSSGDFKQLSFDLRKKDELYQLGETFNKMIILLKKQFERQQQFVSDASHELKTPLTVIESYANMLKRWGKKREDILDEAVEAIHSESIRMKEMTNQMLELASGNGQMNLELETIDLAAIATETAKKMEIAHQRSIIVNGALDDAFIKGDKQKIKQLLFILLDNAIKYSSNSITIKITKSDNIRCEIIDNGTGIAKEDLEHIFERFYRVDKARSRESGGSGLGLAIAQKIVRAHNGEIQVESMVGEGTKVICIFSFYQ